MKILTSKNISRSRFLKFFTLAVILSFFMLFFYSTLRMFKNLFRRFFVSIGTYTAIKSEYFVMNSSQNEISDIYLAKNGTPEDNVKKVVDMLGGIKNFITENDIVIIKPNAQWWNQGRTNLAAIKGFIDLILEIPNFHGEIIIAENHHFMDLSLPKGEKDNTRGWTHLSEINGFIGDENHNINTLISLYEKQGFKNVTKYHWRDGGAKRSESWGNGQNGGLVNSPADGDGYLWTDIDFLCSGVWGLKSWKVKLTYPVFTSKYSGITVDFKEGAFRRNSNGSATFLPEKKVKFINFSVLNTHGEDTGITSSIKNYMGVTDLSCGAWGLEPKGYVNVHECGERFYPYAKAGPIGYFMKMIRKADLNIVTAEWVGWGSRTDVTKAQQMKTILASIDPIALDYYSSKYLVYPLSKKQSLHNPDNPKSSIAKFLKTAMMSCGTGTMNENSMKVHAYDFRDYL